MVDLRAYFIDLHFNEPTNKYNLVKYLKSKNRPIVSTTNYLPQLKILHLMLFNVKIKYCIFLDIFSYIKSREKFS